MLCIFSVTQREDDALDKEVGVAVVGAGFVGGQAHVPAFNKIPGSELVALGDQVEERIKKYAHKYHVKYYLDYDQLLDNPRCKLSRWRFRHHSTTRCPRKP
jgi:hypothetical protein